MTQNTLMDLNNHLFAELERLGDEELEGEALQAEIERAKAIGGIAQQAIANAQTMLKAIELKEMSVGGVPRMLTGGANGA